jgi:membrane protein YdbS with pleckstrin-like domain
VTDSTSHHGVSGAGDVPVVVRLHGDGGLPWRPVSPRLRTARLTVLAAVVAPVLVVAVLVAVLAWTWAWVAVGMVVIAAGAVARVVTRQVSAITWAEAPEELVVRRGRLYRSMVSVPYGRLQYVDVQSGPLARRLGMATVELHTASPASGGRIPGLPTAEAEALRERLAARGESQRAGL